MSVSAYDKYVLENCNRTPLSVRAKTGILHYNRFTNSPLGKKMMDSFIPQGVQMGAPPVQGGMKIQMPEPTPYKPYVAPLTSARTLSQFETPPPSNPSQTASSYAFETGSFMSDDGMSVSSANSLNEKERQRERLYELHNRGVIGNQELLDGVARIEMEVVDVLYAKPEPEPEPSAEPERFEPPISDPMGDPMGMGETPDIFEPLVQQAMASISAPSPSRGGAREGAGRPSRAEAERTFLTGQTAGQQRREAGEAIDEMLEGAIGDIEREQEGGRF